MAQSANQNLIQNLRPFIAKAIADSASGIHYSDAVTNPDLPLKSDVSGELTLAGLHVHGDINLVTNFPKIWTDAIIEIESSGANGLDFQDGGIINAGDGALTIYPNYNLYLWAGDEIWVRTSGTGENVINVDTDDGDLRIQTQNTSIYLAANLGGDIHFEPSGNVYVNGGVANVITTPIGAPADLTIAANLGNIYLKPPGGAVILDSGGSWNDITTPIGVGSLRIKSGSSNILIQPGGDGTIVQTSKDIHIFSAVDPATLHADLNNLMLSADQDVLLEPVGDLHLNPGGSIIFGSPFGDIDVDDTLHFPNVTASFITAAGPLTITPTGSLTVTPTGSMHIQAGGDFSLQNDLGMTGVNPFIDGSSLTLDAWDGNIRLIADNDVVLEPSSNVWIKAGLVVGTPSTKIAAEGQAIIDMGAAQTRAIILISSTVNHGITAQDYTDSFFNIQKWDTTHGGANVTGLSADIVGASFTGMAVAVDTGSASTSLAATVFRGYKWNGTTGVTTLADTENVFAFRNGWETKVIIRGNGSAYVDHGLAVGNLGGNVVLQGQILAQKANASDTVLFRLADASYAGGVAGGMGYSDTFYEITTASPSSGGAYQKAWSASSYANWFFSVPTTEQSSPFSGHAPYIFDTRMADGSDLVWTSQLAQFRNNGKNVLAIRGNGTIFSEGHFHSYYGGAALNISSASPLAGQLLTEDGGIIGTNTIECRSASVNLGVHFSNFIAPAGWVSIKRWDDAGGAIIRGFSETGIGSSLEGMCTTAHYTTSTSAWGAVVTRSFITDGAGNVSSMPATANIFVVRNGFTCDFIFKAGGTAYANISWTTWDKEDDLSIVRAYGRLASNAVINEWDRFVNHNQQDLHDMGLVVNGMTNMTGMMQLHNGALWQLNTRILELENMSITGMIKLILRKWLRRFT